MKRRRSVAPLLTSNVIALLVIADDQGASHRSIAACAEVDERQVTRIVAQLEAAGYISRKPGTHKDARYTVKWDAPVEEPMLSTTVGRLVGVLRGLK